VLGHVLLVLRADATRRERRLAGDLLSAAAGIWGRRPLTRRFDWPAAGNPPAQPQAAARALRALVGKDVQDHGTALLVYPAALAGMLQGGVSECRHLEIPELASLGRDAPGKRTLWRTLAGNP
jgi:hypothetical protein